jgi:iron complex outermembrane receptor protein
VNEKDTSGFLKMEFTTSLFSLPLRGDVGVRYVHTNQSSSGWTSVVSGTTGTFQYSTVEHSYNDVLPAMNLALNVTDDFLVRLGASKVMARAGLGNLNPGAAVSISGASKAYSAGNPLLDPFRAKAYDLGFEWYFAKESLLSLGLFYKDIDTFVENVRLTGQFNQNPSNLPDSVAITDCTQQVKGFNPNDPAAVAGCLTGWSISIPKNTPGGSLKGAEINYQQPFSFLPAPFNNFGTILNYTHVDSSVKYFTNFVNNVFVENTLLNLSKNAANGTLYYDNGTWSVRGSVSYRSPYLTNVPGQNNNDVEGTKSTLNVDAAAAWNVDDHLQLTAEGLNLTNQFQYQYVDSVGNRMNYYHQQGREYFLGFRFKY